MTAARVRGPRSEPPTSVGSMIPSNPAGPSAAIASDENRASLSFCLAAGARMRSAISLAFETAVSCFMTTLHTLALQRSDTMLRDQHYRINTNSLKHRKLSPYQQRVLFVVITSFEAILLRDSKSF